MMTWIVTDFWLQLGCAQASAIFSYNGYSPQRRRGAEKTGEQENLVFLRETSASLRLCGKSFFALAWLA